MVDLCEEYGISRKTGQKIWKRFKENGLLGLEDQRRAPHAIPHRTSAELRKIFVEAKTAHPTWGPRKLKAWLERKKEGIEIPSATTIGYWLRREGLVKTRGRRRRTPCNSPSELTKATAPNDVWCVDFKGQIQLGNGEYCYPLTITDLHSRFLVACTALDGTKTKPARWAFEEAFREYGLPRVIRSDNGGPFASPGLLGLSQLSVFWLRLGIRPERIEPGCPEQNGEHERMHLTLKLETTRPAGQNQLQQQERFDAFREEFNEERPHEALGQQPPSSVYVPSDRRYPDELPPMAYPLHDLTLAVNQGGHIRVNRKVFFLSHALTGQAVGLREIDRGRWLVSFMSLDLGYLNERTRCLERMQ
jgi:transposase InsO family protein